MTGNSQTSGQDNIAVGVVALIVGFFFLGIVCGPIAIYNGLQASEKGHPLGGVIAVLGLVETAVCAYFLWLMLAG
jgi:hypothetical protein